MRTGGLTSAAEVTPAETAQLQASDQPQSRDEHRTATQGTNVQEPQQSATMSSDAHHSHSEGSREQLCRPSDAMQGSGVDKVRAG